MDQFKIFPSIGIARLGGSPDSFYLAAEKENSLGTEIDAAGNEKELALFKDNHLIKRQGARFRVFELNTANNTYEPVDMNSVSVKWSVHLVNKKAAIQRPDVPLAQPPTPPLTPDPSVSNRMIDPGEKSITGKNQTGVKFDGGKFETTPVFIGELKTDSNGNLIVLGGHGKSDSPLTPKPAIQFFYTTKGWFDDTADGSVKAQVTLKDGTTVDAADSWVIVSPPDFAPQVKGVVTLYDVMFQVAVDSGLLTENANPSFTLDILPIIQRFKALHWVNEDPTFTSVTQTDAQLAGLNQTDRGDVRDNILLIGTVLLSRQSPDVPFELTKVQQNVLNNWVSGNFKNDFGANPVSPLSDADKFNKLILDSTVGQGFFPGIEGGIITKNQGIYSEPFRFNSGKITPGDITGLMALPWQADFFDCSGEWWPSQRPDVALRNGTFQNWAQNINGMQGMVDNFNKLGFIAASGTQMVEQERG